MEAWVLCMGGLPLNGACRQLSYHENCQEVSKHQNAVMPTGDPGLPETAVRVLVLTRAPPLGCWAAEARIGAAQLSAACHSTHFPTA